MAASPGAAGHCNMGGILFPSTGLWAVMGPRVELRLGSVWAFSQLLMWLNFTLIVYGAVIQQQTKSSKQTHSAAAR